MIRENRAPIPSLGRIRKAVLPGAGEELTPGERALLPELLDRLADPAR